MSSALPALIGAATLLLNSAIWISGGNGDSSTNGIISIDVSKSWPISSPVINSFPSNSDVPGWFYPRSFASMVLGADGSSLLLYGGRSDSSDLSDNQFSVFDTKAKSWSDPQKQKLLNNSNLPPVFAQSAVGNSKGIAYYYGGSSDLPNSDLTPFGDESGLLTLNTISSNFSYSPASANLGPLAWHTATLVNDTLMYVIGGLKGTLTDDFNVTVYNTATGKWSPPVNYTVRPSGRHGHTAVLSADNSQIIVFGGVTNPNKYLNDVWTLDLAANKWTYINTTGSAPSGRAYHSSALVKNQMIVMFGSSQNAFNNVYVLDTTTWTWTTSFNPNPPQTTPTTPTTAGSDNNNNNDTSSYSPDYSMQKIPISIAGIAGIVLAAIAVASIVMLSVVQPKNRVKPI